MISPGEERREELLLLLFGADGADGAGDDDRLPEAVGGHAREAQLVAHRGHLERVATLAAVLLGPRRRDPALRAERAVELPVVRRFRCRARARSCRGGGARGGTRAPRRGTRRSSRRGGSPSAVLRHRSRAGPNSASARCSVPRRGSPRSERPRLGSPVVQLDVVLEGEPVAAVHVQRGRGRLLRRLGPRTGTPSAPARPRPASASSAAHAASRTRSCAPSTAVATSARPCAIAWNDPMGTPNW